MSNGFETIKQLGTQKIYETTHISRQNIDALLNKEFDAINKVQFAGFVSIIEREFSVDLSELRAEYDAHNKIETPVKASPKPPASPPVEKEKKQIPKSAIAAVALVIVVVVALVTGGSDEKASEPVVPEEKVVVAEVPGELNATEEANASLPEVQSVVEAVSAGPLIIIPKSKLWMGFIDLETYRKEQTISGDAYELDAQKEWLMVFGHGFIKIESGEETFDFRNENKLRFLYEAGVLREIDKETFVRLNRGENW